MVPKLARPEFDAPIARVTQLIDQALAGIHAYNRSPLWTAAVASTIEISRATSHLLRAQLVLLGNLAGGGPAEGAAVERFATGVELYHLFMLVHDDVMDNAQLRRGRPTLRVALSNAEPSLDWMQARDLAVVVGNVIHVLAVRQLLQSGAQETNAAGIVLDGFCRAGAGQFQDLLGLRGIGNDEEALRRALIDKTAFHAFAAPFAAGLSLAPKRMDLTQAIAWGCHLGLAFQAADDLADLVSSPAVTGKDSLRDVLEGRPSLPLFFLRQRLSDDDRDLLDAVIGKHTIEFGVRARLHDRVRDCGVIEACAVWAQTEIDHAAALTQASAFALSAREGMTAIEQGLRSYVHALVKSAVEEA